MPTREELIQEIRERFPAFLYLINEPEVGPLILQAVNPDTQFLPEEFDARLQNTNWWRTTQATRRQWDAFVATDPATAAARQMDRRNEVADLVRQMGLNLDMVTMHTLGDLTLRDGIDLGSATFRNLVANYVPAQPGDDPVAGNFGALYQQIKAIARSEYMLPLDDNQAWSLARSIVDGSATLDGVRAGLVNQSRATYTGLGDVFEQGGTPGAYFAPIRQAIAQELEVSPDAIDLLSPRWRQVTGLVAEGDKAGRTSPRPMTFSEAARFARSTPEWRSTGGAQRAQADLSKFVLETFGAI